MTTAGAARSAAASTVDIVDDEADAQRVVVVYDCSRIGLVANPPGFSLLDLFRLRRRRR